MIFWILATYRSGSSYVTGEIWRRLGGTAKSSEYFNPESVALRPDFTPDPAAPVRSYLDYLMARESVGNALAIKMLWGQIHACCGYPDFIPQLAGRKIVCLRRRDVIRQGISAYIARKTGSWASGVAPRRLRLEEVSYSHGEIALCVTRAELHNALLTRFLLVHGLDHLPIWYEEFVADPDGESARILAHLELRPVASPGPQAGGFEQQSTPLNEEFYERFMADERLSLRGGGTLHGPPLFPA